MAKRKDKWWTSWARGSHVRRRVRREALRLLSCLMELIARRSSFLACIYCTGPGYDFKTETRENPRIPLETRQPASTDPRVSTRAGAECCEWRSQFSGLKTRGTSTGFYPLYS